MALTSHMKMLAASLVVAFVMTGCQSTGNWATAWKDRDKPKPEFKDPNNTEQVSYWPYKSARKKQAMSPVPSQLQEKVAQRSAESKQESQLKELTSEGDLLRQNNQMEDARRVYEKALALSPDNPDVHRRLAIVADLQGNFAAADEHYRATLRLRPRDVDVMSDRGYSYWMRRNPQQAELVLREALLIDPSHKRAMANLAKIYSEQNRYPEALAMFRAGGTEAEAQQNIAKFFPQGPGVAMASGTQDPAQSKVSPAIASAVADNPPDLSKLTFDQIQSEMLRRRNEAKQRRAEADQRELAQTRSLSAGEELEAQQLNVQQQPAIQQQMARSQGSPNVMTLGPRGTDNQVFNNQPLANTLQRQGVVLQPGINGQTQEMAPQANMPPMNPRFQPQDRSVAAASRSNREAEIFRGPTSAPQAQRGWNSQGAGFAANNMQPAGMNNIPQMNELTSSQMATQIGMTVGPGSLFPAPQPTGYVGFSPNGSDSRFNSDFSQMPAQQNQQNWSGNQNDQRRGANANTTDEGLTAGPPSPANNWGPPSMTTAPNWQNGSLDNSDWANEMQSANPRSNGFDQSGSQSAWGQNDARRSAGNFDNASQGLGSPNRYRNGNDAARPYKGAWPNANSLPDRQNQFPPDNAARFDLVDQFGGVTINAGGTGNMNSPSGNGSTNTLPQWPSAPNR